MARGVRIHVAAIVAMARRDLKGKTLDRTPTCCFPPFGFLQSVYLHDCGRIPGKRRALRHLRRCAGGQYLSLGSGDRQGGRGSGRGFCVMGSARPG